MTERVDVAVIGAGPGGTSAAIAAASAGKRVCLIDEGFRPGGQIWRHRPGQTPPEASRLLAELAASTVHTLSQASVFDVERQGETWRVVVSQGAARRGVEAAALVLACGARERFLPFPGWTLPGVMGAGGGQAMLKEGLDLRGQRVVVAGTGPLLLPVGASVLKSGSRLEGIFEQAPWSQVVKMAGLLAASPAKAAQAARLGWQLAGVPYRPGWWVQEALGEDRLTAVRVTDGRQARTFPCDWLFCGFGLVPNLELGRALECEGVPAGLRVDGDQRTTVSDVFAAGEVCGVAGVDAALAEGRIAGLAAAGAWQPETPEGQRLRRRRDQARRSGQKLESIFELRSELRELPHPDTIVCRCEDVPFEAIEPAWGAREAKLCTRAGMGPCQGRVCGPILIYQFGHAGDSVRIPFKTVPLGQLIPEEP